MDKLFFIILITGCLLSCKHTDNVYLKRAGEVVNHSPATCLRHLDSINDISRLSLSQSAGYYYLKMHANFLKEGDIKNMVPILSISQYWLKHKDQQKAAYCYLYNGIISANMKLHKQAAICINEAQRMASKLQDSLLWFYTYYYEGNLYFKNHEYAESKEAFTKALMYYSLPDTLSAPYDIFKVMICCWFTKQYEKANHYFQLFQDRIDAREDSTVTAQMLYQVSHKHIHRKFKRKIANYLQRYFKNDSLAQLYSKMVNTDLFLRNHQLDSAYSLLNTLPENKLQEDPELLLQFYRMKGIYYLQSNQDKEVMRTFQKYIRYRDSVKINSINIQLNKIVDEYTQSKLEEEINLLRTSKIIILLVFITLLLACSLIILFIYLSKKKKNEKLLENELLIDTLQNLCTDQELRQNKLRDLLASRLEISRKLVYLSSQQIPKHTTFLNMYREMMGDIQSTDLDWEELYQLIDCLYDDFHKKLIKKYPNLNEKEIQTCCLLCGGFKTDEIAFVMKQTIYSVHKRKTTLRKELNLEDRSDIIAELRKRLNDEG